MVGWSAAFAGVGLAFIPVLAAIAGPKGFSGLSAADKSLFALVNQVGVGELGSPPGLACCFCCWCWICRAPSRRSSSKQFRGAACASHRTYARRTLTQQ